MNDEPTFDGFSPSQVRRLAASHGISAAIEYIRPFVEAGNTYAMLAMADLEYDREDFEASLVWVKRVEGLVAAGDAEAAIYLSSAYRRGLGGGTLEEQGAKSRQMLERAAEHGYVSCAHALMTDYLYGLNGVEASRELFEYWARKAASLGSEGAQEALRKMERWPNVTPEDI